MGSHGSHILLPGSFGAFAFGTPIEYSTRTRSFDIQFHQRQRQWDRYPQQLLQLLTLNQFELHYQYRLDASDFGAEDTTSFEICKCSCLDLQWCHEGRGLFRSGL
ncbi:uncharacterized protein A4U43_C07F32870 [Asparagus officinalis]|uniref:Uncharacterized protein n=1 Tax=Asparagus officinalis TaxID=4686 RepID=A0A5P1EKB9_ASPOF|nr:uncharacterized protein A4U43_C07F32870 [Asparagus officinalis]